LPSGDGDDQLAEAAERVRALFESERHLFD
jgi:hypothetical protein